MAVLTGPKPTKVIKERQQHIEKLLHSTITDAPVSLVELKKSESRWEAWLSLGGKARDFKAVPLQPLPWHLAFLQKVAAIRDKKGNWRLRTLEYSYRLQEGPGLHSRWFFRFEYKSREILDALHPRNHLHIPLPLDCGTRTIDLERVHIPTGWLTIEELIRFLVNELEVKAKSKNWDTILRNSEERFRGEMARSESLSMRQNQINRSAVT